MAWTYSDYITLTGVARRNRLRLHRQEVSDKITANIAADGKSRDSGGLIRYLEHIDAELGQLERVHSTRIGVFDLRGRI